MVIIITGPTASGKSWLAEQLAQQHNGVIINADMAQLYTACSIGTAKPAWQSQPHQSVLFDWVTSPRDISVMDFRRAVIAEVATALSLGKVPIIVGGSSFYIKSLFYPPSTVSHVAVVPAQDSFSTSTTDQLWQQLNDIDPVRAEAILPTDRYRIVRALIIWQSTGILPSACKPIFEQPFSQVTMVLVLPDRTTLQQRIASRTNEMIFKLGWLDEARALLGTHWEEFIIKKGFVGYADIFSWLRAGQDPATLPELVSLIVTKTRQYAKRQETFLKKLMTELAEHQGQNLYLLTIDSSSPQSVIKAAAMARINQ